VSGSGAPDPGAPGAAPADAYLQPPVSLGPPPGAAPKAAQRRTSSVLAIAVAVASMLAFNWLFLPPTHTLHLRQGENWLVLVIYLAGTWSSTGRSIGKQVMGLRVERRGGDPLGLPRALLRAILCAAFPVGLLWSVVDRRSASVQDLIMGSTVVYDWRARSPSADGSIRPVARGAAARHT
jgi:uncharacterized RDD family membrane protein YckC